MILFDLKCGGGHQFEAWFRNSQTYEEQREAQAITCPVCGDDDVSKAPMAPNISTRSLREREAAESESQAAREVPAQAQTPQTQAMPPVPGPMPEVYQKLLQEAAHKIRAHVEANFDYVGKSFPEEARKIHYGEAAPRPIYGEASPQESRALREEGVEVMPLPFLPKHDA